MMNVQINYYITRKCLNQTIHSSNLNTRKMCPYNSPDEEGHASTNIEEKGKSHLMQKYGSLEELVEGLPHEIVCILLSTTMHASTNLVRVRPDV